MDKSKLDEVLRLHAKWFNDEEDGIKADLREADLCGADLCGADLHEADLHEANLHGANLRGADLSGADLDFSCLPLWCGGSYFIADLKIVYQLLAHVATIEVEGEESGEMEAIKAAIMPYAIKSHRAIDIGLKE